MAFMSTAITKGRGKGIVVSSGKSTEVGKISGALAQAASNKQKTPLQVLFFSSFSFDKFPLKK